ncbi:MAG: AMP-binding protein [Acidobacteria bacterium]|nr:AMP-binding protein [Acidobacteriota bacterium]
MRTLLDLLPAMQRLGDREAIRFSNGFRTWKLSYRQLYARIGAFSCYLEQEGFQQGDRVLLWGDNRIEWVTVFWGCLVRGVQVVPVDARSSQKLVKRIQREVKAKLLVHDDSVESHEIELRKLSFHEIEGLPSSSPHPVPEASPSDIVEIVYTSGTTAEPKGVVHRHKNICANLRPFQTEIERYQKWARPFQPIRILELLPLSHMYGQSLGMFIPLLLGGAAVFMLELNPGAIMDTIRRQKVSVLVTVPRLVKNLQNHIEGRYDLAERKTSGTGLINLSRRWWRYRHVHAAFGWKFWSIIVGGAQLESQSEAFWHELGFLVLQGYGLTETSPVVTVNHPFNSRRGSIGKALKGQEVKIAPDGEILVRGESVVSEYLGNEGQTRASEDGWLHTGDLGEMDQEGHLYFKGRKKDVIVTSEGLNVYPQDVESVLNRLPEIQETTVIGLPQEGEETVHAVLILQDDSLDAERLIRQANRELESHQRIRGWSIWPEEEFPRTPSTLKIKRSQVQQVCAAQAGDTPVFMAGGTGSVESILFQMTGKDASELEDSRRLDEDLGLSSLEQVDLLSQLENRLGINLDEEQFTRLSTIGELKAWLKEKRQEAKETSPPREHSTTAAEQGPSWEGRSIRRQPENVIPALPRWTQSVLVRWVRQAVLHLLILPTFRHYIKLRVSGLENLTQVGPPVIFVANHVSHLDTVAILSALPSSWRGRLAPAMGLDFFRSYFHPTGYSWRETLTSATQYFLACGLFNAYPIPQERQGVRRALQYTGQLIDRGICPLLYPEGRRSANGNLQPFKTGIGFMAIRLQVPVIPIYLKGLYQVYSLHHEWPQAGEVQVKIGSPLNFQGEQDYEKVTRAVEDVVLQLKDGA